MRWGIGIAALGAVVLALPCRAPSSLRGSALWLWLRAHSPESDSHYAPAFRKSQLAGGIGLQLAAAYVGSTLMPPIVGGRAKSGFALLPYYLVACCWRSPSEFPSATENRV